jgi:hypothetical protein
MQISIIRVKKEIEEEGEDEERDGPPTVLLTVSPPISHIKLRLLSDLQAMPRPLPPSHSSYFLSSALGIHPNLHPPPAQKYHIQSSRIVNPHHIVPIAALMLPHHRQTKKAEEPKLPKLTHPSSIPLSPSSSRPDQPVTAKVQSGQIHWMCAGGPRVRRMKRS